MSSDAGAAKRVDGEHPPTEMIVDPRFLPVADRFFKMFRDTRNGGGALAAYLHGEPVLDIWAGWASRDKRWTHDTVALSFSTGKGVASTVLHRLAERGEQKGRHKRNIKREKKRGKITKRKKT